MVVLSTLPANNFTLPLVSYGGQFYPWIVNIGATHHTTQDLIAIDLAKKYAGVDQLRVGNGQGLHIPHIRNAILSSNSKFFFFYNILHVLHLPKNLLYVQKICYDNSCFFEF